MQTRVLGLIACFATALTISAVVDTAEARRGHGGGGRASFSSYSGSHGHRGIHYVPAHPRVYRRNYYYAGPAYYVADACAALRHRAHVTGSRYWWQRYYQCRSGSYYY